MSKQTDLINVTDAIIISGSNVGIGTSSPLSKLNVKGTQGNWRIDPDSVSGEIQVLSTTLANDGFINFRLRSNESIFETGGTERMRIDSSGNLLVGTTNANIYSTTTTGINLNPDGPTSFNRNGGQAAMFNRINSDGDIVQFRKDGSTVGSIGTVSSGLLVGSTDSALYFHTDNNIYPYNPSNSSYRNGDVDLGWSLSRFKDLYLSGGVYLGGTGSANLLDSYEEGSWTPTLVAVSGGALTVSAPSTGYYTKVGRLVTVSFSIGAFSVSGGTAGATINIGGLPFTTQGSGVDSNGSQIGQYNISWSRPDFVALRTYDISTLGFLCSNNGGTWMWETVSAFTGSNKYVNGTITYMTTA